MAKKDFIVDIDLNNQQLLNASLQNLAVSPSTSGKLPGWVYWNTADKTAYAYTGDISNPWMDLGELYQHPSFSGSNGAASTLGGATVIDKVTLTNGHVTSITTRDLTPQDIGASLEIHDHDYSDIIGLPANTILANNTGSASGAKAITSAQLLTMLGISYGTLAQLNAGTDNAQRTWKASDISTYVEGMVNALSTKSNLSLGTRTSTTLPVDNSNGTGVVLPKATTVYAGLMQASDKSKLDGVEADANKYVHPAHSTANEFASTVSSGLKVLSKVSVAQNGHVTSIQGRTITAADLAAVIFDNATDSGVNTTWNSTKINNEIQDAIDQAKTGGLQYKGEYNPSTNTPDIEGDSSIKTGFTYVANATGSFAGEQLEAGDMLIAKADNPGTTASKWQIVNKNIPAILDASKTVKGIIQIATEAEAIAGVNTVKAITPATLHAAMDAKVGGYATSFGDGASTSFTITHGLSTQDVSIGIQKVSTRTTVEMQTAAASNNTVTVKCNIAPASGEYRVIIKK
jgi:hypothetical protein